MPAIELNLLMPAGYSVQQPEGRPLLTDPVLLAPVPEPATAALLGAGVALLLAWRRRRS